MKKKPSKLEDFMTEQKDIMNTIKQVKQEDVKIEEKTIDFSKLKELGKGKFGKVYEYEENSVIKVLGPMNDQIAKEITIHKLVNNRNIISYEGDFID